MSVDPHWTSYVGIIGALTGIAGAALSIIAYRRTTRIKELDLRLALRKAALHAKSDLEKLKELLPHARLSRQRVAAAKGIRDSGAMVIWEKAFTADEQTVQALFDQAYGLDNDFLALTEKELESKTADVHALQLKIDNLTRKYKATLEADEKDRERIRATFDRKFLG